MAYALFSNNEIFQISKNDILILFTYDYDNIENIKSLLHIYKKYNLTDSAKEEFYKHILKWGELFNIIEKKFV